MIELTRLNGTTVVINAELIETVEATPDTVITMVTGRKLIVRDDVNRIIDRVVNYRRSVGMRCRDVVNQPVHSQAGQRVFREGPLETEV